MEFVEFDWFYKRIVRHPSPRWVDPKALNSIGFISEWAALEAVPTAGNSLQSLQIRYVFLSNVVADFRETNCIDEISLRCISEFNEL